jgi:hypothetical protein
VEKAKTKEGGGGRLNEEGKWWKVKRRRLKLMMLCDECT